MSIRPAGATVALIAMMLMATPGLSVAAPQAGRHDGATVMKRPPMTLGARPQGFDGRAIGMFDGNFWTGWVDREGNRSRWEVTADQSITPKGGDAVSAQSFGDFQLHIEFKVPEVEGATGQARGNSGVLLHGRYELQILDSYGQPATIDRNGAIYGQHVPAVNASMPSDVWQAYDVFFRAPRFDESGAVTENPRVTVLLNGMVIHNNVELTAPTPGGLGTDMVPSGPILLQDQGSPVEFRNIWIRTL